MMQHKQNISVEEFQASIRPYRQNATTETNNQNAAAASSSTSSFYASSSSSNLPAWPSASASANDEIDASEDDEEEDPFAVHDPDYQSRRSAANKSALQSSTNTTNRERGSTPPTRSLLDGNDESRLNSLMRQANLAASDSTTPAAYTALITPIGGNTGQTSGEGQTTRANDSQAERTENGMNV